MHTFAPRLAALALAFTGAATALAENWPNWRGPNFDGSISESNLPVKFSKTENVKWAVDLPGPAAATPVIWGDKVFVSSTDAAAQALLAFCFDRKTGKQLWKKEVAPGFRQDDRSNFASPSPVVDGDRVIFFFGNGDLVSFDHDGNEQWKRNIQKDYGQFAFLWTFSTSPLLFDGKLYLQVLQRDKPVGGRGNKEGANDSYLLALDPTNGKEIWKVIRPADAKEESLESFSTPTPHTHGGRTELLIVGGDCITGHDPKTGAELWRWGSWNPNKITHWRLVPSAVAGDGIVLACAPKGAPVYAFKLGQNGNLGEAGIAWQSSERAVSTDVSTPLFYNGRFFILNSDRKSLSCVEPKTGKVLWTGEIPSRAKIEASPTGADGKIYVMSHRGDVYVLGAGDKFELLHTAEMGEDGARDLRSCVAVSQGNIFVRTERKLYCIGS